MAALGRVAACRGGARLLLPVLVTMALRMSLGARHGGVLPGDLRSAKTKDGPRASCGKVTGRQPLGVSTKGDTTETLILSYESESKSTAAALGKGPPLPPPQRLAYPWGNYPPMHTIQLPRADKYPSPSMHPTRV
jgi:hypothetical protein